MTCTFVSAELLPRLLSCEFADAVMKVSAVKTVIRIGFCLDYPAHQCCVTNNTFFQAMVANKSADVAPENLVVRFSEAVDGFPLPKGHSANPDLQASQKEGAEAFLKDR